MSDITASTTELEDSVQIDIPSEKVVRQSTKHEILAKESPVKNVTVFADRAEINRLIEKEVVAGDVEIIVKDLPALIDKDSIRVTCYGSATIVEVSYQSKAILSQLENADKIEKSNENEVEKIRKSLNSLEKEKKLLLDKVDLIEKERGLLNEFSNCVTSGKGDKVGELMEKKSVENFLNFMTVFRDRTTKLTTSLIEVNESLTAVDQKIAIQMTNLEKLKPVIEEVKHERNVSILLDVSTNDNVKLVVSYVVSNASWTPLYDVRAFNKDSTVQILYFAMVKQNTGEDWEDATLSLSTALPCIGGSPPKLSSQFVSIQSERKRSSSSFRASMMKYRPAVLKSNIFTHENIKEELECMDLEPPLFAQAHEGLTSATFEIPRTATIKADDVGHKVSIAQLEFKPEFEYIATPKLVSHAFLKVKARNESSYAMLAGDANIFLDNNFLTKSNLSTVNPKEEFEIALGSDPAVKIEYKPLQKYQQTHGMISKSKVFNYHQVIEIKNTKSDAIKIVVKDQFPKSNTEFVKVTLQDPDIKIPKTTASNEQSNVKSGNATLNLLDYTIDWSLNIPPSENKKINLKFQVEYPDGYRLVNEL